MPVFETSTGRVNVKNWGYMLQQSGGLNANDIAKEHHDLIVMDFSEDGTGANAFSKAQIDKIKDGPGGRTVAVGPAVETVTTDHVSEAFAHPVEVGYDHGRWSARAKAGRVIA